jgi:glycosyltransferase involved in cell wall biosynthesis
LKVIKLKVKDRKKIAVIYQGAKTYGGVEKYLESLFDMAKGMDLTLVSLGEWPLTGILSKKGHRVIKMDFYWYEVWKAFELRDLIEKEKFDLLISQVMVSNFYARLVSNFTKVPNLVVVHSDYEFDYPSGIKPVIYRFSDWLLRGKTDRFITVSEYLKEKLIRDGVKEEKIAVIYNGVEDIGLCRKKPSKESVIGSIGRLHYTKGYHNLIEAMKFLKSCKLVIWGEGEELEGLKELALKNGLKERVSFAGFEKDLKKIFSNIDVYVQPSLSEGFGLTVVEAMLAGKPVIVTPNGSLPELVADEKTGLVTGSEQPEALAITLKTLIEDEALAKELGKKAREEALKRFSVDNWIRQTEEALKEAAK